MARILITTTVMVQERHEHQLRGAGFELFRLGDLDASEDQLCEAITHVDGYIHGGIEIVTERVINAAQQLRVICTTADSWKYFIPGYRQATERGIAIMSAHGANAQSVAELVVALIHERVRNICYLSSEGQGQAISAGNLRNLTLGLIGVGKVGNKVGRIMYSAYGMRILYASIHRNLDFEFATGATHVSLNGLLRESDIINISVPDDPRLASLINHDNISLIRDGGIIVNSSFYTVIDPPALLRELENGRLSVALDVGYQRELAHISSRYLLQFTGYIGYNTRDTARLASDLVTQSMINLLTTGNDSWVVNPEFVKYVK